jgi:hypothetical protein
MPLGPIACKDGMKSNKNTRVGMSSINKVANVSIKDINSELGNSNIYAGQAKQPKQGKRS